MRMNWGMNWWPVGLRALTHVYPNPDQGSPHVCGSSFRAAEVFLGRGQDQELQGPRSCLQPKVWTTTVLTPRTTIRSRASLRRMASRTRRLRCRKCCKPLLTCLPVCLPGRAQTPAGGRPGSTGAPPRWQESLLMHRTSPESRGEIAPERHG